MIVYDKCDWLLDTDEPCGKKAPVRWCRVEERPVLNCSDHFDKAVEQDGQGHRFDMPMSEEEYALWRMTHKKEEDEL